MAIYAVHCAADSRAPELALERARLLRLGFVWPAFLFGPLWLALRGLWRPLALWLLAAALAGAASAARPDPDPSGDCLRSISSSVALSRL